ncbi:MAG: NAD-dependent epimerase/dehydratase family protein [Planctomycetota bacterium]
MAHVPDDVVLITGASGLLGSAIAADLAKDHVVIGLDRDAPPEGWKGAHLVRVDMTDPEGLRDALLAVEQLAGTRLASVIHLAAYYDFSGEDSPLYDKLTVEGTRHLIRQLRAKFSVEQLVFSSSMLVMKPAVRGQLIREEAPTQAEWAYPRSKLDAEEVVRVERGEIPGVILRIAGVYDDHCSSIPIAQQIRRIYERDLESVFFPGNAHHGQAFVHVDDVVTCVRRVVERRSALEGLEVFLVGESDVMSYGELQDRIGALVHGREWPSIRIPSSLAKAGAWIKSKLVPGSFIKPWMVDQADAHYPISIERARERLGWVPRHRLRERLGTIVRNLQLDPDAWYEANGLEPAAAAATDEE